MNNIKEIALKDWRPTLSQYRSCLSKLVNDQKSIEDFKSGKYPEIHAIYEHAPIEESESGLDFVIDRVPHLLEDIDNLIINDKFGSPHPSSFYNWNYEGRNYSITNSTVRYIWNLAYLGMLFEDLDGMDIVEVGPGYGGLFLTLNSYWNNIKSYTFVDVPEASALQKKYIESTGIDFGDTKINYVSADNVESIYNNKYDLFISNWSFSEMMTETQDIYLNNIMPNCKRGMCICNLGADRGVGQRGFEYQHNYEDIMKILSPLNPHMGQTHLPPDAPLLYWGQSDLNKEWMLEMVKLYKHNILVIQEKNWGVPLNQIGTTTGWED
tara:strand:+ start:849 stop:1820 length:972 start_codon:yes stop_codon:yes gene_type:complete